MFGMGPGETVIVLVLIVGIVAVVVVKAVKGNNNSAPMMPPMMNYQIDESMGGAPSSVELAVYHIDGSKLTSMNGSILLGGAPVSLEQIVGYEEKGLLGWTSDEARAWALGPAASGFEES